MTKSRPRHRRRPTLRDRVTSPLSLLRGALAIVVALLFSGLATGGTYALWNSSAADSSATITAGTAALVAPASISFAPAILYPGLSSYSSFVVSNTGNVPLGLQLSAVSGPPSTSFSQSLTIGIGVVSSASQCAAGTFVPTRTATFASVVAGSIGATPLAKAGMATVCLSVSLASTAANGQQGTISGFGLTIGGVQP